MQYKASRTEYMLMQSQTVYLICPELEILDLTVAQFELKEDSIVIKDSRAELVLPRAKTEIMMALGMTGELMAMEFQKGTAPRAVQIPQVL